MSLDEILPYLAIISFFIAIGVIIYQFGKWRQKTETEKEEIKKKLDTISEKIEKIPDDLLAKSIDIYKILDKLKEKPKSTKKGEPRDE